MALKKNKEYLAIIDFLSSYETVQYKVKSYLFFQEDREKDEFLDLIKLHNLNHYDLYMEDSFNFLKNQLKFDFSKIFNYLGQIHFTTDNGKIYYSNKTLESYQYLSSAIDIKPLIAFYLLDYTTELDDSSRYRFFDNHIKLKFQGNFEKRIKEISDLHVHLGGVLTFDYRLHHILKDISSIRLKQEHEKLFNNIVGCSINIEDIAYTTSIFENMLIKLFFFNQNILINKPKIELIEKDLNRLLDLLGNHEPIYKYIEYQKYTTDIYGIRKEPKVLTIFTFGNSFEEQLLKKMFEHFQIEEIEEGDMYLLLFLSYQMQQKSKYSKIIEIYFLFRTIIKNFIVQQHQRDGLGYFSLYSRSSIRRAKKEYEKRYIMKILLSKKYKTNIEARVSLSKNPHQIMDNIVSYIKPFKSQKQQGDKLKFIFHFKKDEDKSLKNIIQTHYSSTKSFDISYLRPKWFSLRKEIKFQAIALQNLLIEPKYRKHRKYNLLNPEQMYKDRDYIKKYIGGIDVAGREFLTPPEVYAPIFRYFKSSIKTSGLVLKRDYPYIPPESLKEINFKYTYHVGEDYRDILSGLRAIYEAIIFLDLKNEDRLGHALALGVNPKKFLLRRNSEIKLSKLEVLDNSIFAFYMINKFNIEFMGIKNQLQELIHGLSKEIYKPLKETFSIDDLIDAWFLRRNCPNEIKFCKNLFGSKIFIRGKEENRTFKLKRLLEDEALQHFIPNINYIKSAIPDFFPLNKSSHQRYSYIQHNPIAYHLLWLYQKDPDVAYEGSKEYGKNFIFEDGFYEYIQDSMMEYIISKRDIVIESMLTSNILIGGFSHYHEHPIFRFKPISKKIKPNRFKIRTKKLKIVLGTDNPGVQNSFFLQELQHLKNACIQKGSTEEESYNYIKNIIDDGNRLF